jgi:hypothetical protein
MNVVRSQKYRMVPCGFVETPGMRNVIGREEVAIVASPYDPTAGFGLRRAMPDPGDDLVDGLRTAKRDARQRGCPKTHVHVGVGERLDGAR